MFGQYKYSLLFISHDTNLIFETVMYFICVNSGVVGYS